MYKYGDTWEPSRQETGVLLVGLAHGEKRYMIQTYLFEIMGPCIEYEHCKAIIRATINGIYVDGVYEANLRLIRCVKIDLNPNLEIVDLYDYAPMWSHHPPILVDNS